MKFFRKGVARVKGYRTCKGADGRVYHSGLEASVNNLLMLRERAGEIRIVNRQERVPLVVNGVKVCSWVPDFTIEIVESGKQRYAEAKGFETDLFLLKKKLYMAVGTKEVEIWKGTAKSPRLIEILVPKGAA